MKHNRKKFQPNSVHLENLQDRLTLMQAHDDRGRSMEFLSVFVSQFVDRFFAPDLDVTELPGISAGIGVLSVLYSRLRRLL